jgi:hypothetical protein
MDLLVFKAEPKDLAAAEYTTVTVMLLLGSTYYSVLPFYTFQSSLDYIRLGLKPRYDRNTSAVWCSGFAPLYHLRLGLRRVQRTLALGATPIAMRLTFQGKGYYMYRT